MCIAHFADHHSTFSGWVPGDGDGGAHPGRLVHPGHLVRVQSGDALCNGWGKVKRLGNVHTKMKFATY